jgi:lipopolysaccharide export LptBFGC system permease protein LptF
MHQRSEIRNPQSPIASLPMPWTLYRYILKDVLKLLLLSTAVVVTVLSFAASVKPLADGLINFEGMVKFIGATMPTMLVYALPFSTAFSVALTFCRLTNDNEIVACAASGVSYGTILLPIIVLGAALMTGLYISSNWVLPRFNRMALAMVQRDLIRMLVYQINRGEAVQLGEYVIYADQIDQADPPVLAGSAIQPQEMVILTRATLGRLDPRTMTLRSNHSAERVEILVFRDGGRMWVQFRAENPMYDDEAVVQLRVAEQLPNIELPNRFVERPRVMSWPELIELSRHPQRYPRVVSVKQELAEAMAKERLLRLLEQGLARGTGSGDTGSSPPLKLRGARETEHYEIRTAGVTARRQGDRIILQGAPPQRLRIDYFDGPQPTRRYEVAGTATFSVADAAPGAEPRLIAELKDVTIIDPARNLAMSERNTLPLARLWWPRPILEPLRQAQAKDLMADANQLKDSPSIARSVKSLNNQVQALVGRIIAEMHVRAASSFACMLAAALAAVLSIDRRGSLSLVVFFHTFLLVLTSIIVIHTGARFTADPDVAGAVGISLLWSGNLALAGYAGHLFAKVSRN